MVRPRLSSYQGVSEVAMRSEAHRSFFSPRDRRLLAAVAGTAVPGGRIFPAAGERVVAKLDRFLAGAGGAFAHGYRTILWALEASSLLAHRRGFADLDD